MMSTRANQPVRYNQVLLSLLQRFELLFQYDFHYLSLNHIYTVCAHVSMIDLFFTIYVIFSRT